MQNLIDQLQRQLAELQAAVAAAPQPQPEVPAAPAPKTREELTREYWAQFDWANLSDGQIAKLSGWSQPSVSVNRRKFGFSKSPGMRVKSVSGLAKYTPEQLMSQPIEYWAKETGLKPATVRWYGNRKKIPMFSAKKFEVLQVLSARQPAAAAATPEPGMPRMLHNCRAAIRRMREILTAAYNTPGAVSGGLMTVTEAEVESWLLDTRTLVEGGQQ